MLFFASFWGFVLLVCLAFKTVLYTVLPPVEDFECKAFAFYVSNSSESFYHLRFQVS